jgi:2-polyprenyl-3-methyl-5-hydroxy-6-metoxy-1,4-benzoquinol methylase/ribosomal protein S27E
VKESEIRPEALFGRYLELVRGSGEQILRSSAEFVRVPCPGCGAEDGETVFKKEGFQHELCGSCGSLFVSPRPSPALLDRYYTESEAVRFWRTHFFKETAEARREKMFRPRAEEAAALARAEGLGAGATLADVGAGYGIFLEEIAKQGVFSTVIGVEPAPALAEECREKGFTVFQMKAEAVPPGTVRADIVTAYEVLEHVFDPCEFLQGVSRLLRPGGLLLFTTLTVSGFDIQVLWEHSRSVSPPQHLNLLSLEGVRRLVRRSGLVLARLDTPGRLDIDIVRNAARVDPEIVLPRFVQRVLERGPAAESEFQDFLQRHHLSSHVRALVRA